MLLIFPPIGPHINKRFVGFTTFDSVIHITLSFLFLEFASGYRAKVNMILDYEFDERL